MSDAAASGYVDPNFPDPHGPHDARIIIYGFVSPCRYDWMTEVTRADTCTYRYIPSAALAILGIVLFAAAFVLHAIQVGRHRLWSFSPFAVACVMEVVGYIFRYLSSHDDPYSITYFVVEYFFIVTAPVLMSAAIYVCLSRIINWAVAEGLGARYDAWLRPKLILWGFITCDVITTVAQVAGAALVGTAESNQKSPTVPNDILIAGLAFQTFAFSLFLCLFITVTVIFHKDVELMPKMADKRSFFIALATASTLVYIRTIFRLVESAQGVFGYLSTHELLFGILDFAPIVVAAWTLVIWHPGRCLPNEKYLKARSTKPLNSHMREGKNIFGKEAV